MSRLTELVAVAMAEGGPLHREMQALYGPNVTYRPQQAEAAQRLAEQHHAACVSNDERCHLYFRQIAAGVGKSLMLMVVLGLASLEHRHRIVLSTYTTGLRRDLAALSDIVNRVIAASYEEVGAQMPKAIVKIAERRSVVGYAARSRIPWLRDIKGTPEQNDHRDRYIDWLLASEDGDFQEWLSHPDSDGRLPFDLDVLALALSPNDLDEDCAVAQAFRDGREDAKDADIVVVTHAMAIRNIHDFGNTLESRIPRYTQDSQQHTPVGGMYFDEADTLPAMLRQMSESMVGLNNIEEAAARAKRVPAYSAAAGAVRAAVGDLRRHLLRAFPSRNGQIKNFVLDRAETFDPVLDLMRPLHRALNDLYELQKDNGDLVQGTFTEGCLVPVHNVLCYNDQGGTHHTEQNARRLVDAMYMIEYRPNEDHIYIGLRPRTLGTTFNRMWRVRTRNMVRNIGFMSATLRAVNADPASTNQGFMDLFRDLGVDASRDLVTVDPDVDVQTFGKVRKIVYLERDPSLKPSADDVDETGSFVNPEHTDVVAEAIAQAHVDGRRAGGYRILALLCSSEALRRTAAKLREAGVAEEDLFIQHSGVRAESIVRGFADNPNGIWLSMNWAGINPVWEGRTLVDGLFITKIPMPVADPLSDVQYGPHRDFQYRLHTAARVARNGVGRGARSASDEFDLYVMDVRWPLHEELAGRLYVKGVKTVTDGEYPLFRHVVPQRMLGDLIDPPECLLYKRGGELVS